ncbi:hypothetical protein [Corynebacterium sp. sy039]|uniref:hypothetical protein n=1 Tax=Corynebacterium sp. sy039 TaxID=2599641 RepID=UPI0011B7DF64|nr:hypothetical protein [Corynebacterium sp. sy039]QDZ41836.1 hypothetical protein FQV43_00625 [Corynebacterium sp. sy039]
MRILSLLGAEINGQALDGGSANVFVVLGYVVVLASCWVAATSSNQFDGEFGQLLSRRPGVVKHDSVVILCVLLGMLWYVVGLMSFLVCNPAVPSYMSVGSYALIGCEVITLSAVGCCIGLLFQNPAVSVTVPVLYFILVSPAVHRLFPWADSLGIAERIRDISLGESTFMWFLWDMTISVLLCALLLIIRRLVSHNRKRMG